MSTVDNPVPLTKQLGDGLWIDTATNVASLTGYLGFHIRTTGDRAMATVNKAHWWLVTTTIDGVKYVRTTACRWSINAGSVYRVKLYGSLTRLVDAMDRANVENWEAYGLHHGTRFDCCGNVFRDEEIRGGDVSRDKLVCVNGKVCAAV